MAKQVFENREELVKQIEAQLEQAKAVFANLRTLGDELGILSKANVKGENPVNDEEVEFAGEEYGGGGYKKPDYSPCGCYCQTYPCKCKKCDFLKSAAFGKWELGFYALEQAWNTLGLAEDQFEDGTEALEEAIGLFIGANKCSQKYDCDDYCKRPRCGCC